jgi:NAD(P)-dependent dehydrogenase (short-subunit alcohol dehydrogenase family)
VLRPGLVLDPHRVIELAASSGDEGTGVLAARLGEVFEIAQLAAGELAGGGCIVLAVRGGAAARAGATALMRSLALEWAARGIRVSAVCGEPAHELVEFIASPAGRMLTGAVLDG